MRRKLIMAISIKSREEPNLYKSHLGPKMGTVRVDRKLQDKEGASVILLQADLSQTKEGYDLAKKFIMDLFEKDEQFRNGQVYFTEQDWKNGEGDKLVKAIATYRHTISWTDGSPKKDIFKGLKSMMPPGALGSPGSQNTNPSLNNEKGGPPSPMPTGPPPVPIAPAIPEQMPPNMPQKESYLDEIKKLIQITEKIDENI